MTSFRLYLPPHKPATDGQLSNYALIIAGMASPIVDGDGGIGLGVVEDHEEGIFCIIDPWSPPMQAGDIVDVYLDANVVWHHELLVGQENERLFFFVDREWFAPGWIERCYYVVLRKNETIPDDPSSALRLLVKLDRPGGRDKNPHLPGHSELKIVQLPAEVIAQGVDAEWAAKGVPMMIEPYPNIALRDVIQVKWGSVFLEPLVLTPEQAEGTQPIEIIADQAKILAGGDSNALLLQYQVHDEVWNHSEKWSMSTTVRVDAGAWRLTAPIIEEAEDGVIDLKALNQQPVTVQILLATEEFEIGDTVTMTWIGTPQVGKPLINTQAHEITNIPSILPLEIPYAEVRAIAMGSADASYVLTKKNGDPPLSSKRAFASVVGDVYAHPAPVLREQVGDSLDPDTLMANVDISYPGIASGDVIELIWEGLRSDSTPYVYPQTHTVSRNEAEEKSVTLYVSAEHIGVLANGRLDLWYQVSNDQVAIYGVSESEHLLVKVHAPTATLPPPIVPEAESDVLDPSKVIDKVTVQVDYPGTVKGDILTYYWIGTNPLGSTSSWIPITTVSAGRPVSFRVDARFVTSNIGQTVKVRYTLKHASGAYSYSQTLDLLIGFLVGELPPPKVVQAPDALLDPFDALAGVDIEVGYGSMDPSLDTIILKWLGTPGPGTSEDQEQSADQSGKVLFHLDASFVGANINRLVNVSYGVDRYGYVTPSEILPLIISVFTDPETQLPHPQVTQAADQVLNLATFSGNAEATLSKWPFSAAGQKVWLRLEGQTENATPHVIVLLAGTAISEGQASSGLRESVLRNELENLGHDTPLELICKVNFSGEGDEAFAIGFPITRYIFKTRHDWVVPEIQRVYDTWGDINEGGTTVDSRVTLSGVATRESTLEFYDATSLVGTTLVTLDGSWTFVLSGLLAKAYRMTAQARDGSGNVSNLRTFSAVSLVTPSISSVTDSRGEVADGATTVDTTVTLSGRASNSQQVEIFDGTTSKGT
ncbi:Ig-like domain repeat protein, partial [Pseudomonas brassicacearum]|uniref:Ig-like domain repeat protein n=1 Tax=Pseudomonas brassicacearum TaxID=930166 RepID=UPI001BDEA103